MQRRALAALFLLSTSSMLRAQQQTLPLYTGTIPDSKPSEVKETSLTLANGGVRISHVVQPTLTVFPAPADKATGTAIIICPGGGYARLAIDHEGYDVAKRLNEMGITAFVLKYRLPNNQSQPDQSVAPLLDAQQAIRLVREQAATFRIHPNRVGLMGFSAGGHLASTAGTRFARPADAQAGPTSVRPDFLVLLYPVVSFSDSLAHAGSRDNLLGKNASTEQLHLYSNELQVSAQTPPTFLVHAQDDQAVPVLNSVVFYEALTRHKVPAELHLYPKGGHGFGLHNQTTPDDWPARLRNWLAASDWLKE